MLFNLIRPDSCRSYSSIDSEVKYAVILEMPHKVRGGDILHVIQKNLKCPKVEQFFLFFDSKTGHVLNF